MGNGEDAQRATEQALEILSASNDAAAGSALNNLAGIARPLIILAN